MTLPATYRIPPCCFNCKHMRDGLGGTDYHARACARIEAPPASPFDILVGRTAHLIGPYLDWASRNDVRAEGICDEWEPQNSMLEEITE